MLNTWHRLEQVIKWTGLSINAFALHIGLKRSENLYQIKKGHNGISRDLAELITVSYPEISKAWLLTGEGAMMVADMSPATKSIPFYSADVVSLIQSHFDMEPNCRLFLPMYQDCDFAALCVSDAMADEIQPGAILFCRRVEVDEIIPGGCYLVCSDHFVGVRYVRNIADSMEQKHYRLEAHNRDKYDDFLIAADKLQQIYVVRGVLTQKSF